MVDKILTPPAPVALETPQAVIAIRALSDSLYRIDRQYLPAGLRRTPASVSHMSAVSLHSARPHPGAKPPDRAAPKS
jgi:hypothetical protein